MCIVSAHIDICMGGKSGDFLFGFDLRSKYRGTKQIGVFVTIWGNNFGATQGSSTVTVGGGKVN